MDTETRKIVAGVVVDKRETDMKSTAMERRGLERTLAIVTKNGGNTKELVTDAHTEITKWLSKKSLFLLFYYYTCIISSIPW